MYTDLNLISTGTNVVYDVFKERPRKKKICDLLSHANPAVQAKNDNETAYQPRTKWEGQRHTISCAKRTGKSHSGRRDPFLCFFYFWKTRSQSDTITKSPLKYLIRLLGGKRCRVLCMVAFRCFQMPGSVKRRQVISTQSSFPAPQTFLVF